MYDCLRHGRKSPFEIVKSELVKEREEAHTTYILQDDNNSWGDYPEVGETKYCVLYILTVDCHIISLCTYTGMELHLNPFQGFGFLLLPLQKRKVNKSMCFCKNQNTPERYVLIAFLKLLDI